MPRPSLVETSAPGQDSFLDIMANMVGILIILVVLAGMRVKNAPATPLTSPTSTQAAEELRRDRAAEQSLTADAFHLANQLRTLQASLQQRFLQRSGISDLVSAMEQKLAARRAQLDAEARQAFDLRRSVQEAAAEVERLHRQRAEAEQSAAAPTQVECYPTPLSKTVDSDEAHFQLRAGRIVWVPLEELLNRLKADAEHKVYKLRDQGEITETLGPVEGFRLRYTLQRRDIPPEEQLRTRRSGYVVQLTHFDLLPVSGELGEPLAEALAADSALRRVVSTLRPGRTTITLWVYPDSFAEFRRVKEELFRLGFATAARPLPDGILIGGSPHGSKSNAE